MASGAIARDRLNVHSTDNDLLSDGLASVRVINRPDDPIHVRIDRHRKSIASESASVVLATDHDPVPVASANLPLVGRAVGANGAIWGPITLVGCNGLTLQITGTYNGYRLAEIVGASNPSGWSECLKVKNPGRYILLYSNP